MARGRLGPFSSCFESQALSAVVRERRVYFTSLVRHGFMPSCFRDCIVIPVPKKNKDVISSSSYRPIALASSINKILEHLILTKFSSYLHTSPLQFGFKPGSSTSLCTGVVNVSAYLYSRS